MPPTFLRVVGIVLLIAAAAVAVLNLKGVAGLGAFVLPTVLIVLGLACILRARKRRL